MSAGDPSGPAPREQITLLLQDWSKGNKQAGDLVMATIYAELHKLAESHLRRAQYAGTLQPTVIVHEAYLRLVGRDLPDWQSRSHFFGIASRLMRQIVVDHARARTAVKRGGGQTPLQLNEALKYSDANAGSVVALDDASQSLNCLSKGPASLVGSGRARNRKHPNAPGDLSCHPCLFVSL